MKTKYTRKELIELCEKSIVPQKLWRNRDSAAAQMQVGQLHHLLLCGCKFSSDYALKNDAWTIWINVHYKGFNNFEGQDELQSSIFYLPTQQRLDCVDGGDWY